MNPGNSRLLGFSKLEIAFILVLVALVGVLAITRYLDLSVTARQSVDSGVVAAVRKGIADYALESQDRGRFPVYPPLLDQADIGEVTSRNPFFTHVVENGLAVIGWVKTGPDAYRAPDGESFTYVPGTGDFSAAANSIAPRMPRPSRTQPPASTDK